MFSLSNPIVQSIVVPLVVALVATGLLRLLGGQRRGAAIAGLGAGLGALAGCWAIFGIPSFPPAGSTNKLFYVIAIASTLGLVIDLLALPQIAAKVLAALSGPAGIAWIGGAKALAEPWPAGFIVVVSMLVTAGAGWRLANHPDKPADGGVMLLVAALAMSISALLGNTASSAQLAGATAAALGGFLLRNWPKPRFRLGCGILMPVLAVLAAMAVQIALFTKIEAYALIPLAFVLFANYATHRLSLGTGKMATALTPVVTGLIAAIPAAVTVAAVYLTTPESSGYY